MAIIGNLFKLEQQLSDKNLHAVFDYFKEAMNLQSSTHQRIFSRALGAFEKVSLTDNIFALEQLFYTKPRNECLIESHQKYIDFQLILEGVEQMEYIDIDKLETKTPYDEHKDLITYDMTDVTSKFVMQKGDLAIFFPDDAHIGLPMYQKPSLVYKTVIKLPLALWNAQ